MNHVERWNKIMKEIDDRKKTIDRGNKIREEIYTKLARKATILTAGGFSPSGELTESWLGQVFLFKPDETIPVDSKGANLLPLAQLYLPNLPFVPSCLKDFEVITAFISNDFPDRFEPMGKRWLVREYSKLDDLIRKDIKVAESFLKAFPISSELVEDDWPTSWTGYEINDEDWDYILEMEEKGGAKRYYDLPNNGRDHKVGGYPFFCQSGIDPGEGFEFAFQVSSDKKINLRVYDCGCFQFYRNPITREWKIYYDFY